jgi:hypothetical protein
MRMTGARDWRIGTKGRIEWREIIEEANVFLRLWCSIATTELNISETITTTATRQPSI